MYFTGNPCNCFVTIVVIAMTETAALISVITRDQIAYYAAACSICIVSFALAIFVIAEVETDRKVVIAVVMHLDR
jgi:hypothetical protein